MSSCIARLIDANRLRSQLNLHSKLYLAEAYDHESEDVYGNRDWLGVQERVNWRATCLTKTLARRACHFFVDICPSFHHCRRFPVTIHMAYTVSVSQRSSRKVEILDNVIRKWRAWANMNQPNDAVTRDVYCIAHECLPAVAEVIHSCTTVSMPPSAASNKSGGMCSKVQTGGTCGLVEAS